MEDSCWLINKHRKQQTKKLSKKLSLISEFTWMKFEHLKMQVSGFLWEGRG